MAEIFLGKHIGEDGFERLCCVKRILPHYAQEKEYIEMFRDEAHIGKRLQHANIVRVEGFEEVDGSFAIIMEFINGGDLRSILSACEKARIRPSVPMAVYIIAEAARGLHYAHTKHDEITGVALEIVHRDISPQNILVSLEGEIKVTDFGIADAESKETETKPGIVKGKYSYMSPEQIMARPVDARTDIFALAIILWETLAMKRLFHAENEIDTIQLVRNCTIQYDLMTLNPEVDEQLLNLIKKGLSKDSRDRFQNAAQFEKELRMYLSTFYNRFTVQDLGAFVKKLLSSKIEERLADIKEMLSQKAERRDESKVTVVPLAAVAQAEVKKPIPPMPVDPGMSRINQQQTYAGQIPDAFKSSKPQGAGKSAYKPANSSSSPYASGKRRVVREQDSIISRISRFFLFALISLSVGFAAMYYYRKNFVPKGPASITIKTSPDTVILKLNGTPLYQGRYVKTPLVLRKIPSGSHELSVLRPGFSMETLDFQIREGEEIVASDIVLKQIRQMAPVRVSISSFYRKNVKIELDGGMISNTLSADEALNLQDITFGETHKLLVFPNYPQNDNAFTCHFVPRAQNWQAPFLVLIEPTKQKCSYPLR